MNYEMEKHLEASCVYEDLGASFVYEAEEK